MRPLAKQILTFLLLVFAFSSVPYFLVIRIGHLSVGNGMIVGLLMWCPALAAFATCAALKIDLASLGWSWRPARYEAWAYVIPILYALPVYAVTWVAISGSFNFEKFAAPLGTSFGFPNSPCAATFFSRSLCTL